MKMFLLFIFLPLFIWSAPLLDRNIEKESLQELLSFFKIDQDEKLIENTQKWLRKQGSERWHMQEIPERTFVLDWAAKNGLFTAWQPSQSSYDKALVLGAATPTMHKRLSFLKQLWMQGIRFNQVVWLTGQRPLDSAIDILYPNCATESHAARFIWQEADLPQEMKDLPVFFIEVPMEGDRRPNTADTINAFAQRFPDPASLLFVSDQPFCLYQFSIVQSYLPDTFTFDLVGPGVNPHLFPQSAAVTLDTIARWLYQQAQSL